MLRHQIKVVIELTNEVLHLGILYLNNETIWQFGMLGRDHQVIRLGDEHLY
jgi:hypothetical protein